MDQLAILGVSHAVIASASLSTSLGKIEALGYVLSWFDETARSSPAKNPFLTNPHTFHAVAFARKGHGCPIELVSYPSMEERTVDIFKPIIEEGLLIGAEFYATDIANSAATWSILGFEVQVSNSEMMEMWLPAQIAAWRFRIRLRKDFQYTERGTLDTPGFNCISFLTTHIDSDRIPLLAHCKTTGPFSATINNRVLRAEIFRTASGEYIELIQVLS